MITIAESAVVRPLTRSGQTVWSARAIPAACVMALAASAPFETTLFALGPLTFTTLELATLTALAISLAAIAYGGAPFVWQTPITAAAAACLTVLCLAAVLSPLDRGNALRFTGRMFIAAAVCLLTVNAVTSRAVAKAAACVMLIVAAIVSIIAVLEAAQVAPVLSALTTFRPGFHVVGGQLRATSTMFYPTITSMYLEVVFAIGLWLLLDARKTFSAFVVVFVALVTIGAGIIATFTRAGLIAMASAIAVVACLHLLKTRRLDNVHARLGVLAAALVALVVLSRSPDVLLTRLRTEGSQNWYGATYSVPPTLYFRTGADYQVPVTLANTGGVVWDSSSEPPFAMSYHWLRAGSEAVVRFEGWRTLFPAPVQPRSRVTLPVNVRAPGEPGTYVLVWDIAHERRAWFSTEGVAPARSIVHVIGERVAAADTEMSRLPAANRRVDRLTLWNAALRVAAGHPLLGIGPDNFRLAYGRYIGRDWDRRVHANNMYLEVLAGAGLLGLGALLWLLVASGAALLSRWRQASGGDATAAAVFCAIWATVAGHGLVDSFLSFTTTYVMFALAAGLAFSSSAHAHRV